MMISPERMDIVQRRFVMLFESLHIAPSQAYPLFDELVERHSEPHRYYHNLEHLGEMFKVVGKLLDGAIEPPALMLAVWFHDAIYDPKANDNEAQSATLAVERLQALGLPVALIEHVRELVLATAHLSAEQLPIDGAILLDADLAILAAEEKRYQRYALAIRQEYAWVADDAYRHGRMQVLQHFLARPRLYRTDRMFAVAEEPARANLQRELQSLSGQLGS